MKDEKIYYTLCLLRKRRGNTEEYFHEKHYVKLNYFIIVKKIGWLVGCIGL